MIFNSHRHHEIEKKSKIIMENCTIVRFSYGFNYVISLVDGIEFRLVGYGG